MAASVTPIDTGSKRSLLFARVTPTTALRVAKLARKQRTTVSAWMRKQVERGLREQGL